MPQYLTPGVYIEEIEIGPKPIESLSTSTAGFLGKAERGPDKATLITSFADYSRIYGGFLKGSNLTYAIDGFFRNGGNRCYISKISANDSAIATFQLNINAEQITVNAVGRGSWGNRIFLQIGNTSSNNSANFKLTILYYSIMPPLTDDMIVDPTDPTKRTDPKRREPDVIEIHDDLSFDQNSSSYFKNMINGVSNLIVVSEPTPAPTPTPTPTPIQIFEHLSQGGDGSTISKSDFEGQEINDPEPNSNKKIKTGLKSFEVIDDISIICSPEEPTVSGIQDSLIDHCENLKYRFAILQTNYIDFNDIGNLKPSRDSKYAALYGPWVNVFDPLTGGSLLIPPGGHIAGIYARSDSDRGVHKAPANEVVRGAISMQVSITKNDQAVLNPRGINVIRPFPGRGILLWGARTISKDPLWKYVNVRRLFIFIEQSIDYATQWAVFEPNSERLWSRMKATCTQFLTQIWHDGALMGITPDQAFFVKCDRTTMTQNDIDNGRLIVVIGIAPVKPAEFVVFRIAQVASGAEVSEV